MSAVKKATNSAVNSAVIIMVPSGVMLPGIIACHTNTGCKKQTTDIIE